MLLVMEEEEEEEIFTIFCACVISQDILLPCYMHSASKCSTVEGPLVRCDRRLLLCKMLVRCCSSGVVLAQQHQAVVFIGVQRRRRL